MWIELMCSSLPIHRGGCWCSAGLASSKDLGCVFSHDPNEPHLSLPKRYSDPQEGLGRVNDPWPHS